MPGEQVVPERMPVLCDSAASAPAIVAGYNHCASPPRSSRFPFRRCALHCVTCGSGMPYVCALPCPASKLYPSGCLCYMAVSIVPYSTAYVDAVTVFTFGSGTSISLSGCMDAIGQPIITDAEQAYTSMLLYMVPDSVVTDSEILPALMYLTSHFMTGSVRGLQTLTYNLRYHMRDCLNWGFFDQALCEEICPEHVYPPAYTIPHI